MDTQVLINKVGSKLKKMNQFLFGGANRPVFFDIDRDFPFFLQLQDHYQEIQSELCHLIESEVSIPRYEELDTGQITISSDTDAKWGMFLLNGFGYVPDIAKHHCPRTLDVLSRIPKLMQANFSILTPGKSIPAHSGHNIYLRYHLGLIIPQTLPPVFKIADQTYAWTEGDHILFDDSWEHQVVNSSPETRGVLIVDIYRPAPNLLMRPYIECLHFMVKKLYGHNLIKKHELFYNSKNGITP